MARSKPGCGSKRSKSQIRSNRSKSQIRSNRSKSHIRSNRSKSQIRSKARPLSKSKSKTAATGKNPGGNQSRDRKRSKSKTRQTSRSRQRRKTTRSRRKVKSMSPKCPKPVERPKLPRTQSCVRSGKDSKSKVSVAVKRTTSRKTQRSNSYADEPDAEVPEAPIKSKVLSPPLVSPRDPNHYRVIELDNGVRALLISTCGYGTEEAQDEIIADVEKNTCAAPHPPTSVFNRRRGKRGRSDEEKERKKRSRVARRASAQITTCDRKVTDSEATDPAFDELPVGGIYSIYSTVADDGETQSEIPPGKDKDEPYSESQWLPEAEPADEKLRNAACAYVRKRFPQIEVSLTIGCGSLYDPASLRGLSNLTWKAIQRALKKSIIDARRDESNTVNATIITVMTKAENLAPTLNILASKVMDIATNKRDVTKDIDDIDEMEEVVQCFFCWSDPMEDERRQALLCSLAKENHPIRHVSYRGYPPDLWEAEANSDLIKEMEDFLVENYLGKAMTVTIKAPESLDTLAKLVTDAFYKIPNGDLGDFVGGKEPFDTEDFYKFYRVKCTNPGCCDTGDAFIVISWALPAEMWEDYEVKPLEYISALISSRAPGGLMHLLKEMKLSSSVDASCRETGFHRNQFYSFFEIQVRLTEAGFNQISEVIETVFSYINFMRASGPQENLYREMQQLRGIQFNALGQEVDLEDPYPTSATKISYWLQLYESKDVIMGPFLMKEYSSEVIQACTDLLVPDKANYMLCSCFEEPLEELKQVEPMYSTMYDSRELTADELESWKNAPVRSEFAFPEKNEFISPYFCMSKADTDSKDALLYDPGKPVNYRIWIEQNLDHMHFTMSYVHFISTEAFAGPENAVMLHVWYLCLKDILEPLLYPATVADIHYNLQPTHHGLLISIYSWNHNYSKALELIISEIAECGQNISEDLFSTKKGEWLRHLSVDMKDVHFSSHFVSHDLYETITVIDHWPSALLYNELKEIDHEEFQDFANEFCERSTFVAILRGNVVTETAVELAKFVEENFPLNLGVMEDFQVRILELPLGDRIVRLKSYSEYGGDSHVTNFYQIGAADAMSRLCAVFIQHLLSREMARDLKNRELKKRGKLDKPRGKNKKGKGKGRGKNQNGGDSEAMNAEDDDWLWMQCDLRMNQGILTLCCHCEGTSSRYTVDNLECKLDTFLTEFMKTTLCPMTNNKKEFNGLRTCLERMFRSHTGGYHELCTELDCLYEAVKSLTLRFNEVQCMLACLRNLRVTDVQAWYNDHCMETGCAFRKLSVQLVPKPREPDAPSKTPAQVPPKNKQEWRARRKQLRDCTYKDYHRIVHLHKPNKDETFGLVLETDKPDENNCGGNDYFITDWASFKTELMEYPDEVTDD